MGFVNEISLDFPDTPADRHARTRTHTGGGGDGGGGGCFFFCYWLRGAYPRDQAGGKGPINKSSRPCWCTHDIARVEGSGRDGEREASSRTGICKCQRAPVVARRCSLGCKIPRSRSTKRVAGSITGLG